MPVQTVSPTRLTYSHAHGGTVLTTRKIAPATDTAAMDYPGTSWPLALAPLKLLAKPGERGLGDIIARLIGPIGGDAYKAWYQKTFGHACGCADRQAGLNARFPLALQEPPIDFVNRDQSG